MTRYFKIIPGILLVLVSSAVFAQSDLLVKKAKQLFISGRSVSAILSDPQFDTIRPDTEFREQIRQHASPNPVRLVTSSEPGTSIGIKGRLVNSENRPLPNTLIYVYQTDTRGWYGSDRVHFQMVEGDRKHARLFAYFTTNAEGKFEISTIQPHGYPESHLPAHIHFEVFNEQGRALLITELLFDDDDRLEGEVRRRSEREGFLVSRPVMESGKKVYDYTISVNHK